MVKANCHCRAVNVEAARAPRRVTDCNCSICRRYAALWAYYKARDVRVTGKTDRYLWGDRMVAFHRCKVCGCITHYTSTKKSRIDRVAVNARLFDPEIVSRARIRRFDGAVSWKVLD
jgi:hypothetical protein